MTKSQYIRINFIDNQNLLVIIDRYLSTNLRLLVIIDEIKTISNY